MEKIITIFGDTIFLGAVFLAVFLIAFSTEDEMGRKGILQIVGNGMTEWKEDNDAGYFVYQAECEESFPKAVLQRQTIFPGTYDMNELFAAYDNFGNAAQIRLYQVTFADGQQKEVTENRVTFDVPGIYVLQFEVKDEEQRISDQKVFIPVQV